jgi:hypothetical protein
VVIDLGSQTANPADAATSDSPSAFLLFRAGISLNFVL